MTWLVTGGAGYIGAHTVRELLAAGEQVVVLDDLSSGDPARLPVGVPLVVAAVHEQATVRAALRRHRVRGVVHLAGRKSVTESLRRPTWYHAQNVGGLAALLSAMGDAGVDRIVFSSSAAVYGAVHGQVTETAPTRPANPYGHSKLLGEHLLRTAGRYGLSWAALRYFNVAGCAAPHLADRGATNLIPLALRALRGGVPLTVAGADYPTADGTGVRDYVHVRDVARAHAAAIRYVAMPRPRGRVFNVGTGRGCSVLRVVHELSSIAGAPVPHRIGPRRDGDPAETVAAVDRIRRELGWTATYDLTDILTSAWYASAVADQAAGAGAAVGAGIGMAGMDSLESVARVGGAVTVEGAVR